eukprot:CAMPEP_0182948270 /NCGR_PEP_ID=MMETSP0105_2-20130417/59671_1 /TAXON_ID=81532 ORGANISM="Acanthoeca-like sp., Strain 10tr" /NCGR_SAMPLE_ID=MMETSP0105_2 /ASSEMBLY_ACC=CAM_ASM_000205 /LENGTH=252 /DNA_ID=CAMNT_0025088559 /DNA_START=23 /DNA_END=781 /DNA_ORIENTATION=+
MPKKVQMKEEPQGASLFQPKKRTFGIGGDIPGKRDLGRFVKWPKYVRLQRQKAVLMKRLKVPPAIAQFANTADKGTATELFRLLDKYTPETRLQKRKRLAEEAKAVAAKQEVNKGPKPMTVKYGINHITWLIEEKKAQLVVIAHDVEPIEVVIFLPALCRKMGVPYCIVKSKARLGQVVNKKTATALAFTEIRKEDQAAFNKLKESIRVNFNDRFNELNRRWGGGIMGAKTVHKVAMYEKQKAKELAAREGR